MKRLAFLWALLPALCFAQGYQPGTADSASSPFLGPNPFAIDCSGASCTLTFGATNAGTITLGRAGIPINTADSINVGGGTVTTDRVYAHGSNDIKVDTSSASQIASLGGTTANTTQAGRPGQTLNLPGTIKGGAYVDQLPAVTGLALQDVATGGTLLHATQYCYRVSNLSSYNTSMGSNVHEGIPGTEVCQVTGGGADTHSIILTWTYQAGEKGYGVYGRGTGAELFMSPYLSAASVVTFTAPGVGTGTFTDTNAITPSGAIPATNRTGGIDFTTNGTQFVGDPNHVASGVYSNTINNSGGAAPGMGQSTFGAIGFFAPGTIVASTNYGAFTNAGSVATNIKFREVSCSHGTAGTGSAGTLAVRNVTDSTTLCSGSYTCTTTANTPTAIFDCNQTPTSGKLYAIQFSTGCGGTQVSNMGCNVEVAR